MDEKIFFVTYPGVHIFACGNGGTATALNAGDGGQNKNVGNDFDFMGINNAGNEAGVQGVKMLDEEMLLEIKW